MYLIYPDIPFLSYLILSFRLQVWMKWYKEKCIIDFFEDSFLKKIMKDLDEKCTVFCKHSFFLSCGPNVSIIRCWPNKRIKLMTYLLAAFELNHILFLPQIMQWMQKICRRKAHAYIVTMYIQDLIYVCNSVFLDKNHNW